MDVTALVMVLIFLPTCFNISTRDCPTSFSIILTAVLNMIIATRITIREIKIKYWTNSPFWILLRFTKGIFIAHFSPKNMIIIFYITLLFISSYFCFWAFSFFWKITLFVIEKDCSILTCKKWGMLRNKQLYQFLSWHQESP